MRVWCDAMRILHVTHQYRPAVGGAERHITNLSEELARRGHQVDVYTTRSTDHRTWCSSLPHFEELDGVSVYRFDSIERGPRTWKILNQSLQGYWRTRSRWFTPFIIWGNGPVSPKMIWRLLRDGRRYDLIHVNSLHYAPVSYVYGITRLLGVPCALTPFVHITQPGVFDIGFQNAIMRRVDLIVTMTEQERDYLHARGVARHQVVIAGSGIYLEDYAPRDPAACRRRLDLPLEAFVLLFLGRKEAYKGLETLLEAFVRVQSACPDLYLVAAGAETEHSRDLRQRFAGLERVHHFDRVSDEVKLDLLNACDVLVLPSVAESFGIVYIEAWAVGKAVLGVKGGAVPGVISDGVDGLLAAPQGVSDLADKILQLYHDRDLGRRLGMAGHQKALTRYTVQRVADVVEGAYLRTVRVHKNARRRNRHA